WDAFFASPNDEFDKDQYAHSKWFEACCGEQRSVATLKQRGDWDEIWFQMRPRKAVNVMEASSLPKTPTPPNPPPGQTNAVQIAHFDFDSFGVQLMVDTFYAYPVGPQ